MKILHTAQKLNRPNDFVCNGDRSLEWSTNGQKILKKSINCLRFFTFCLIRRFLVVLRGKKVIGCGP